MLKLMILSHNECDKLVPQLKDLIESDLEHVADQMLAVHLFPCHVSNNPSFTAIMKQFRNGFKFLETLDEVKDHCTKYFSMLYLKLVVLSLRLCIRLIYN